jgi:hypothetical protein
MVYILRSDLRPVHVGAPDALIPVLPVAPLA